MSWYVLNDDERGSLRKWSNDVASSKSDILIVDEAPPLTIIYKEYIFGISHQIQSLMRRFFRKNRCFRKRLAKTKGRIVETIQLLNAATLQQMSEEKKKEKNEKMISVGEKSAEDVKMKKVVKKKFSKKENLDTMMFEIVDVKDSNAMIFMKYHIDDTTTILDNFTKEKNLKKNENGSFEKAEEKKTDE